MSVNQRCVGDRRASLSEKQSEDKGLEGGTQLPFLDGNGICPPSFSFDRRVEMGFRMAEDRWKGGATGLKDLTITVPPIVKSGDTVTLSSDYDLEGSSLYTIQWFFEDTEFYRYTPERVPPYSSFKVDGINVNDSKSNIHNVTLMNVSRKLSGEYKCEVSAGWPSYHTLIERARMKVVDIPKTDPTIGTEKERITVGETLRANCTSGSSSPASTITWKLNRDLIANDSSQYRTRYFAVPQEDGSETTKSIIEFKVLNDMFRNGRLHLRCTAFIADIYRKSADIEITEDAPRIASITGESPPRGHQSNGCSGLSRAWPGATIVMATMIFLMMTPTAMPMTKTPPKSGSSWRRQPFKANLIVGRKTIFDTRNRPISSIRMADRGYKVYKCFHGELGRSYFDLPAGLSGAEEENENVTATTAELTLIKSTRGADRKGKGGHSVHLDLVAKLKLRLHRQGTCSPYSARGLTTCLESGKPEVYRSPNPSICRVENVGDFPAEGVAPGFREA
ncbi:hypothetical protein KM043_006827 [Ampulex compressa]|nr:hypothetical protein KM043_006827 [Ampulex compressa]